MRRVEQPEALFVQLLSHVVVDVHSSLHPVVQPVIRQPRVLLHWSAQFPPGQSTTQSPPLTLLQVNVQPPPVQV